MQANLVVHPGKVVGTKDSLEAIDCEACGFIHLSPFPESDIYSNGIYHSSIKPTMSQDYSDSLPWWHMVYSDWSSMIDGIAPGRSLIDVGAGTGEFVRYSRSQGWNSIGIESDPTLSFSNSLFSGTYRKPLAGYQPVDLARCHVISAHWVMEHLLSPSDFLSWAHDQLLENGVLLITIPNDFTPIQLRAMEKVDAPYYWLHHTHINYWNRQSFIPFVAKHGFQSWHSKMYGSWQPEKYLEDGLDYIHTRGMGAHLHQIRMEEELKMKTDYRRARMKVRGLMGWGRDVTYVFTKK